MTKRSPLIPANSLDPFRAALEALEQCHHFLTANHQVLNHAPDWLRDPGQGGLDCGRIAKVIQDAREELRQFDTHVAELQELRRPLSEQEKEDDILICCALRIDGYRYMRTCGFDAESAIRDALKGLPLPAEDLHCLTMLFLLQRILYKWGGERLPRNGYTWRLFRALFLRVYRCRVPVEFRAEQEEWRLRWRHFHRPRIDAAGDYILKVHQSTDYKPDDAQF